MKRVRTVGALVLCLGICAWAAFGADHAMPDGGPGSGGTVLVDPPEYTRDVDEELARATQRALAVAEARELASRQTQQSAIRRLLTTMMRRMGQGFGTVRLRRMPASGPLFEDPEAVVDFSYGKVTHTDTDVSGHSTEESIAVNGSIGSRTRTGMTLHTSRTYARGALGYEVQSRGMDAYASVDLNDSLSAGAFVTGSQIDEENAVNGSGYGAGANLCGLVEVGKTELTASVALARTVRDQTEPAGGAAREYDTVMASVVDAHTQWSDLVGTSLYAFYSDSLASWSARDHADRNSWVAGVDVALTPSDRWGVSLGYEKALALKNVREYRVNASFFYSW